MPTTAGCLAASIDYFGEPRLLCTNPAAHPALTPAASRQAREHDDELRVPQGRQGSATLSAIVAGPVPTAREKVGARDGAAAPHTWQHLGMEEHAGAADLCYILITPMAGCAAPELADLYVCGRRVMPN